jgi:hypothetical protein
MHSSLVDDAEADYIPPWQPAAETNRVRFGFAASVAASIVAISIGCYVGVKTDFLPNIHPPRWLAYVVRLHVK